MDPRLPDRAGLGRRAPHARRARQRRHARGRRERAREFGAEGIGLCRTEHMFFGDRPLADDARDDHGRRRGGARRALDELLPLQRADFEGIFEAMDGPAGDDPAARSAAARVPAGQDLLDDQAEAHESDPRVPELERTLTARERAARRPTRCSARAAAAWNPLSPSLRDAGRGDLRAAAPCVEAAARALAPR